jgi:hypothetical protein
MPVLALLQVIHLLVTTTLTLFQNYVSLNTLLMCAVSTSTLIHLTLAPFTLTETTV